MSRGYTISLRLVVLVTMVTGTACSSYDGGCDQREAAFHESGHAIYGILTGFPPSMIIVSRGNDDVKCPGSLEPEGKYCGFTCFSGVSYGNGLNAFWERCSLDEAGRYGVVVSLGYDENARCHSKDDEHALSMATEILALREAGDDWLPGWEADWSEDDEPTANGIVVECRRHAYEMMKANRDALDRLGEAMDGDADGRMTREEVLDLLSL